MLSWLGHLESKARIKALLKKRQRPCREGHHKSKPLYRPRKQRLKMQWFIRVSKITEGWSQLCQQLSSSQEQPNPRWPSQQSHGPVSDTLQRSPCPQHQLCPSIQNFRISRISPPGYLLHSTLFLQIHSGRGRHRAGDCCTLCRAQQWMESWYNSYGSHHNSGKEARGSRRKHQSCG